MVVLIGLRWVLLNTIRMSGLGASGQDPGGDARPPAQQRPQLSSSDEDVHG